MQGRRETALARGEAMGWTVEDGGVPRAVYGAWRETARETRAIVRAKGVKGDVPRLDERVSGKRGKAAANEHFGYAMELAARGVSEDEAVGQAVKAATLVIRLAYQQHRMQQGPKAS